MFRRFAFILAFAVLVPGSPAAAQEHQIIDCTSLEDCFAKIRDPEVRVVDGDSIIYERMPQFGDAAIEALLPMLSDSSSEMRRRAGYLLANFDQIDPRFSEQIIMAWQQGNGWLPRAVAALGTDEALSSLWQDFLRDSNFSSNSQVFMALGKMGEARIRPLLLALFAECRLSLTGEECSGMYSLLSELEPAHPEWSQDAIVDLAQNARKKETRDRATEELVRLEHPAGLVPSQERLANLTLSEVIFDEWPAWHLIDAVATYGSEAATSAAHIAQFLDTRLDERLRTDAALALGRVGNREQIPALLALEPELMDDWLMAYNVSESLGRLRAEEARALLLELTDQHWHRGVRNNANRALAMISGGEFSMSGVAGDGLPYPNPTDEEGNEYLYFGGLRWAGDEASQWCGAERNEVFEIGSDPAGQVDWPSYSSVVVEITNLSEEVANELRDAVSPSFVRGSPIAFLPLNSGKLIGFNGGEFGGGVVYLDGGDEPRLLFGEPVDAMWTMNDKLYVVSGLAHMVLDTGHVRVINLDTLEIERVIRLPASSISIGLTSNRNVIVETREGDFAISEDGELLDARDPALCP
jgi:HEAT repeat protein